MSVPEKCDVYSFGIVTLERMLGVHPGDLLSSLSSSRDQHIMLTDVLDHRISLPPAKIAAIITEAIVIEFQRLDTEPQNRPTMKHVSRRLSVFEPPRPLQDLHAITLPTQIDSAY